jgi:hypothetical protein
MLGMPGLTGEARKHAETMMGRTEHCANQAEMVVTGPPVAA